MHSELWQRSVTLPRLVPLLYPFLLGMLAALGPLGVASGLAQPVNDNFAQPLEFPSTLPAVLEADTTGATVEPGEPSHGLGRPMHSLWWRWVAPTNGEIRVQGDSYYDPVVAALYTGNALSGLVPVVIDPAHGFWSVEAGQAYQWAVDTVSPRTFQLRLTLFPTPLNDAFASRAPLPPLPFAGTSDLAVATREAGEPPSPSYANLNIWYTWTAPTDGQIHLKTPHSFVSFDAFTGEVLSALTPVPVNVVNYEYVFEARAGVTYQIAMGRRILGNAHDEFVAVPWTARFDAVPANASLHTRLPLPGRVGELIADGHLLADHRLWYEWIAPAKGTLVLGNGTGYFGDDPARLVALADSGSGIAVTQGMAVKVSVIAPTAIPVTYRFYEQPSNDLFAGAQVIQGSSVHVEGHNFGAGREAREPKHGRDFAGRSIWYRWTAPTNGWVTWRVETPGFTPSTKVYAGDSLSRLKPVPNQSQVASPEGLFGFFEFQAVAGRTYAFVVDNQRTRADEGRGYYVNPAGTFEMQFTFTTLQLHAALLTASDGSPVLRASFSGEDGVTGAEFGLVQLDRFCSTLTATANAADGVLFWTNPPSGRFLLTAAATRDSGDTVVVSPLAIRISPANDNFSAAEPLHGYQLTDRRPMAGATREPGEPSHGAVSGLGSIWWRWTAPVSGPVDLAVTLYGHRFGYEPSTLTGVLPALGVYRSTKAGLAKVAVAKPSRFTTGTHFRAEAKVTYFIAGQMPPGYFLSDCAGEAKLTLRLAAARMAPSLAGASFVHGTGIPLAIESDLPLADIEHVEYFEGNARLGSSPSPFENTWAGAAKGPHPIMAKLFLRDGTTLLTDPVEVFVKTRNDYFADAVAVTGEEVHIYDDVAYATREPSEPRETGPTYGDSVWYRWTATKSGRYFVRLTGFGESWFLYTGASLKGLKRVPIQTDTNLNVDWFDAVGGTTYPIAVKRAVQWPAPFELSIVPGEPPSNDSFARAQALPPAATNLSATLRLASLEAGEPGTGQSASVWFTWRAPADGVVAFKRPAVIYDIHLFQGDALSGLEPLMDLGDPDAYFALVPLPWRYYRVQAGQTYRLQAVELTGYIWQFDRIWDLAANRFGLEWVFAEPPANDAFTNAVVLPSGSTSYYGGSLGASSEPADLMAGQAAAVTRWWNWVAPADGILRVSFSNQYVAVFRGETLASLQLAPGNSVFGTAVEVQAGEVLRLCAYHWHPHVEAFSFQLDFQPTAMAAGVLPVHPSLPLSGVELAGFVIETAAAVSAPQVWTVRARPFSSSGVELLVTGEPDRRCVVESSSDLITWTAISPSGLITGSSGEVRVPMEFGPGPARFFRVKALP